MKTHINTNNVYNVGNYVKAKQLISQIGGTRETITLNGKVITEQEYKDLFYFDNTPKDADLLLRVAITLKNNYK